MFQNGKIQNILSDTGKAWKENCFQLVPLLFAVILLIAEMFTYKVFKINKSFFNPLQQSLPLVLFVYGLGWIIAGKTAKILFTITLSAATFLTWLAVFTAIVFKLPLDSDIFAVLSASSSEESKEFFAVFANWKWIRLLPSYPELWLNPMIKTYVEVLEKVQCPTVPLSVTAFRAPTLQ